MKTCIIATENYLYDSRMYWKEACSLKNMDIMLHV